MWVLGSPGVSLASQWALPASWGFNPLVNLGNRVASLGEPWAPRGLCGFPLGFSGFPEEFGIVGFLKQRSGEGGKVKELTGWKGFGEVQVVMGVMG